jgi:hypothetical protein
VPESWLVSVMCPAVTSTVPGAYDRYSRKVTAVSALGGGFLALHYFLMLW